MKNKNKSKKYETVYTCDFCGGEFQTKKEAGSHEQICKKNPENQKNFLAPIMKIIKNPIFLILVVLVFLFNFDSIKKTIQYQLKIFSLRQFHSNISNIEKQWNWSLYYEFLPNSTKKFVTRSQYINYMSNLKKPFSTNIVINNIKIDGDTGIINRTRIECATSSCNGNDKSIDTFDRVFFYTNGYWKIPEEIPSDRALNISSFEFVEFVSETNKQNSIKNWGKYGVFNLNYAIYNFALSLDNNPEQMIKEENLIENYKADKNRQANTRTVVKYLPSFPMTVPTFSMPKTTHCRPDYMGGVTCTTY